MAVINPLTSSARTLLTALTLPDRVATIYPDAVDLAVKETGLPVEDLPSSLPLSARSFYGLKTIIPCAPTAGKCRHIGFAGAGLENYARLHLSGSEPKHRHTQSRCTFQM
jgi:hypothetical protein